MAALSGTSAIPRASSARAKRPIVSTEAGSGLANPDRQSLVAGDCFEPREGRFDRAGFGRRIDNDVGARGCKILLGRECHGEAPRGCPVVYVKQAARGNLAEDRRQRLCIRSEFAAKKIRDAA
jgi:hypothetical protein